MEFDRPTTETGERCNHDEGSAGCRVVDLRRRVENCLALRNVPALRRLTVEVMGDTVVLQGRVSSFYEKQLANHTCRHVAGVMRLLDQVDVSTHDDATSVRRALAPSGNHVPLEKAAEQVQNGHP